MSVLYIFHNINIFRAADPRKYYIELCLIIVIIVIIIPYLSEFHNPFFIADMETGHRSFPISFLLMFLIDKQLY